MKPQMAQSWWRRHLPMWYLSRRMWEFLTKRMGNQAVTFSGVHLGADLGIGISLSFTAGAMTIGGWPFAQMAAPPRPRCVPAGVVSLISAPATPGW